MQPWRGGLTGVCTILHYASIFCNIKYFHLVEFSAKFDDYSGLGLDIISIIFHSLFGGGNAVVPSECLLLCI